MYVGSFHWKTFSITFFLVRIKKSDYQETKKQQQQINDKYVSDKKTSLIFVTDYLKELAIF